MEEVFRNFSKSWPDHPVVSAVVAGGSHELLRRTKSLGYRELPGGYAGKCHLCTHIRCFLVERGLWPEFVGPRQCYAVTPKDCPI